MQLGALLLLLCSNAHNFNTMKTPEHEYWYDSQLTQNISCTELKSVQFLLISFKIKVYSAWVNLVTPKTYSLNKNSIGSLHRTEIMTIYCNFGLFCPQLVAMANLLAA